MPYISSPAGVHDLLDIPTHAVLMYQHINCGMLHIHIASMVETPVVCFMCILWMQGREGFLQLEEATAAEPDTRHVATTPVSYAYTLQHGLVLLT